MPWKKSRFLEFFFPRYYRHLRRSLLLEKVIHSRGGDMRVVDEWLELSQVTPPKLYWKPIKPRHDLIYFHFPIFIKKPLAD